VTKPVLRTRALLLISRSVYAVQLFEETSLAVVSEHLWGRSCLASAPGPQSQWRCNMLIDADDLFGFSGRSQEMQCIAFAFPGTVHLAFIFGALYDNSL